jgi:hypothetical protein
MEKLSADNTHMHMNHTNDNDTTIVTSVDILISLYHAYRTSFDKTYHTQDGVYRRIYRITKHIFSRVTHTRRFVHIPFLMSLRHAMDIASFHNTSSVSQSPYNATCSSNHYALLILDMETMSAKVYDPLKIDDFMDTVKLLLRIWSHTKVFTKCYSASCFSMSPPSHPIIITSHSTQQYTNWECGYFMCLYHWLECDTNHTCTVHEIESRARSTIQRHTGVANWWKTIIKHQLAYM